MPASRLAALLIATLLLMSPCHAASTPTPTPAPMAVKPTVLLLDGLGIYTQSNYIGVSTLAKRLQAMGFRTVVDTHMMMKSKDEHPVLIIGHSMGGLTALKFAGELVAAGQPAPMVITLDPAPLLASCPVSRCINIHTRGFPDVEGAENIDTYESMGKMIPHPTLPNDVGVQDLVLGFAAPFVQQTARR